MEKRFLKFLLFGVFTFVFSLSFVSCGDDYDDSGLKTDMQTKLDKLTSDLAAAQTQVTEAKAAAKAAGDAGEAAKIKADLVEAALKQMTVDNGMTGEQLAAMMGKLQSLDATMSGGLSAISSAVKDIQDLVAAMNDLTRAPSWVDLIAGYNKRIQDLETQSELLTEYFGGKDLTAASPTGTLSGDLALVQVEIEKVKNELRAEFNSGGTPGTGLTEERAKELAKEVMNGMADEFIEQLLGYTPKTEEVISMIKNIIDTVNTINSTTPGEGGTIDPNDLITLRQDVDKMITSITLINEILQGSDLLSSFSVASAKADYTFGKDMFGEIKFTKDTYLAEAATAKVLVQVTPANAVLDDNMLSKIYLVNSRGNGDINTYIKAAKVMPYNGLITRAMPTTAGLYEITLSMQTSVYNGAEGKANFEKLVLADPVKGYNSTGPSAVTKNQIAFAIAVESKISTVERHAMTEFALMFKAADETGIHSMYNGSTTTTAGAIQFSVGGTSVGDNNVGIKNRYTEANELAWANDATNFTDASNISNETTDGISDDNRNLGTAVPVTIGTPFEVKMDESMSAAYAWFITFDDRYTNADEKTLWESASSAIEGINTVYRLADSPSAMINIKSESLKRKEVGFRVWAVNADGTLVDPDGRAFYVNCGGTVITDGAVNFTIDFSKGLDANGKVSTDMASFQLPAGVEARFIDHATFTLEDPSIANSVLSGGSDVNFYKANGTDVVIVSGSQGTLTSSAWGEIAKIQFGNVFDPTKMKEGQAYKGTMSYYDEDGLYASQSFTFTKNLPAAFPASIKLNPITPGSTHFILAAKAYDSDDNLITSGGTVATGRVDLAQVFTTPSPFTSMSIVVAGADVKGTSIPEFTTAISSPTLTASYILAHTKVLIENNTALSATVKYNYGAIRYGATPNGSAAVDKYEVPGLPFTFELNSPISTLGTWSFNWGSDKGTAANWQTTLARTLRFGTNNDVKWAELNVMLDGSRVAGSTAIGPPATIIFGNANGFGSTYTAEVRTTDGVKIFGLTAGTTDMLFEATDISKNQMIAQELKATLYFIFTDVFEAKVEKIVGKEGDLAIQPNNN